MFKSAESPAFGGFAVFVAPAPWVVIGVISPSPRLGPKHGIGHGAFRVANFHARHSVKVYAGETDPGAIVAAIRSNPFG